MKDEGAIGTPAASMAERARASAAPIAAIVDGAPASGSSAPPEAHGDYCRESDISRGSW